MKIIPQPDWVPGGEIIFTTKHMAVRKSVKHVSLYFVDIATHDITVGAVEDKAEAIEAATKLQGLLEA